MKFTDLEHLKKVRILNNLNIIEKSLYKEFELGKIDKTMLMDFLFDLAEHRENIYKALE